VYPDRGSRMQIKLLGNLFPVNQVSVDCYTIFDADKINKSYETIKKVGFSKFTEVIKERQKIELLKVPILVDLANDYLENNLSVVIFVNFTKTIMILKDKFPDASIIYGEQTIDERNNNIEEFMENKKHVIICNIKAGGQSISLDDKYGVRRRVSLINPSFSAIELIQALGRINRASSKSPSIQKIVLCDGTIEKHIANKIKNKMECINELNDNDLQFF
jgi:superfamily II DNA or RNA helicase